MKEYSNVTETIISILSGINTKAYSAFDDEEISKDKTTIIINTIGVRSENEHSFEISVKIKAISKKDITLTEFQEFSENDVMKALIQSSLNITEISLGEVNFNPLIKRLECEINLKLRCSNTEVS